MFGGVNPPGTPPFLCTFFFGGQVQAGGERKGGVGVGAAVTSAVPAVSVVSSTATPRPAAPGARVLCLVACIACPFFCLDGKGGGVVGWGSFSSKFLMLVR